MHVVGLEPEQEDDATGTGTHQSATGLPYRQALIAKTIYEHRKPRNDAELCARCVTANAEAGRSAAGRLR